MWPPIDAAVYAGYRMHENLDRRIHPYTDTVE